MESQSMNKVTSSNGIMATSPSLPRLVSVSLTSSVGSFRLSNPLTSVVFIVKLTMANLTMAIWIRETMGTIKRDEDSYDLTLAYDDVIQIMTSLVLIKLVVNYQRSLW